MMQNFDKKLQLKPSIKISKLFLIERVWDMEKMSCYAAQYLGNLHHPTEHSVSAPRP